LIVFAVAVATIIAIAPVAVPFLLLLVDCCLCNTLTMVVVY
jgi:hypothetical protein